MRSKGTIQGHGLFAVRLIAQGELVWALDEPTFGWDEIKAWGEDEYRDFRRYGFQCGVDRYSLPEGLSREMNHSCDPNAWWSGSDTLVARRNIEVGEEITYDYSSCDVDLAFEMKCACGAQNCRGTISSQDYKIESWREQYGLNLPPHVLAAIDKYLGDKAGW